MNLAHTLAYPATLGGAFAGSWFCFYNCTSIPIGTASLPVSLRLTLEMLALFLSGTQRRMSHITVSLEFNTLSL